MALPWIYSIVQVGLEEMVLRVRFARRHSLTIKLSRGDKRYNEGVLVLS